MAGEYLMPALLAAQIVRQQVLDFLHGYPEASMEDIAAAIPDQTKFKINGTVACMAKSGEVKVTGPHKARQFTAMVTTTASAAEKLAGKRKRSHEAYCKRVGHEARVNKRSEKPAEPAPAPEAKRKAGPRIDPKRPWVTIHECGDTAPADDSRGQGSVRPRVHVNCHQSF